MPTVISANVECALLARDLNVAFILSRLISLAFFW